MMSRLKRFLPAVILLLALIAPLSGRAEENIAPAFNPKDYIAPNSEVMANLMWRTGAFTLNNTLALDEYLRLTNCQVYNDFFKNDVEWLEIRSAMSGYLSARAETFPNKFVISSVLDIGRYMDSRGGFEILPKSAFVQTGFISLYQIEEMATKCGMVDTKHLQTIPNSYVLRLDAPLTLDFIRATEEQARKVVESNLKYYGDPQRTNVPRVVTLDLYITVDRFLEYGRNSEGIANFKEPIFLGTLDRLEVYADPKREIPLLIE